MELKDKVCLVTGAAKRVGRVIALSLARRGAQVVVHYHTSSQEALAAAEECTRLSGGREALALGCDQSDTEAVARLVAEAEERLGRIDVLVNNAALFHPTPFLEMKREDWDQMLDVNLRGPAWFCRCVAPGMIERGEGVMVNIADTDVESPAARFLPYSVSKGALIHLTRGLARELAPAVRVNAIGPGTVLLPPGADADLKRRREESTLLGRIGAPEDIASACVFLIEGSDFMTGTFLTIDGGKSIQDSY